MNDNQRLLRRNFGISPSLWARLIAVLLSSIVLMTLFEAIKQVVLPMLTNWESAAITIGYSALLATTAAYIITWRYYMLHQQTLMEIDERRMVEAELRHEREFSRTLLDSLDDGVVACDADGNLALFNRAARDWYGIDALKLPPEQWAEHYDLYYADGFTPLPTEAIPLQRAFTGETVRDAGMVISARGQPARYILANGGPIFDEQGNKVGAIATMHDITASKQAEEALARERHLIRMLMDSIPDTIYFKDIECRFLRISRSQAAILGVREPEDAVGKTDFDFFGREHALAAYNDEQEIIRTGNPIVDKEELLDWPDRPQRWVTATKMPLRDDAGQIIGTFGISRDITDRKLAEEKLLFMSSHDALTGLFNRAYFEQAIAQLRYDPPFPVTLVMIDIDGMKRTNDIYGHTRGDELLRRTASVLNAVYRKGDIVTRIGGDEFAVILPNSDPAAAGASLERLRRKLSEHNGCYAGDALSLSIGAATAYEYGALSQAIIDADRQMYQDKQTHHMAQLKAELLRDLDIGDASVHR
ncbi:MAG: diguanylate cyclase [Chloroflexi bacterium]|nr:diguanylate cyclase [Chloroflexota bacterium]MCL5273982.1 diguanylate cyclase [Chloroflexota bacterium]